MFPSCLFVLLPDNLCSRIIYIGSRVHLREGGNAPSFSWTNCWDWDWFCFLFFEVMDMRLQEKSQWKGLHLHWLFPLRYLIDTHRIEQKTWIVIIKKRKTRKKMYENTKELAFALRWSTHHVHLVSKGDQSEILSNDLKSINRSYLCPHCTSLIP